MKKWHWWSIAILVIIAWYLYSKRANLRGVWNRFAVDPALQGQMG